MSVEYIAPRIEIIEVNNVKQIKAASLASIGVVGTFEKGPVNKIVSGDLSTILQIFGGYNKELTGFKSILAAAAQGANDFKVIRIGGSSIKEASVILKDSTDKNAIEVKAITEGSWGNDIKVAVASGTQQGSFKLIVIYNNVTESFDNLSLTNLETIKSKLITVAKTQEATQIPKNITSIQLAGGDNGAKAVDSDYIGTNSGGKRTGLKLFETIRVGIVICAQQHSEIIRNALITHALNMTPAYGLRVSILNTPVGSDVDEACALTANYNTERSILAYPWCELADISGEFIAPDGFYAGRLSVIDTHKSPSNKQINGIVSQEVDLTETDIKNLTLAKISPIGRDSGYRIRNGLNLAGDQTNVRRVFDEIEMEIYDSTGWAKSENIAPRTMQSLSEQIDIILGLKKDAGKIYDFQPTVCDESINTPESMANRILKTRIRIRPSYAADYIDHYVEKYIGD